MAATIHSIAPLAASEDFEVNDSLPFRYIDSEIAFRQAHAVMGFITVALCESGGLSKLPQNEALTQQTIEAAQTLLEMGLLILENERARGRTA